MPLKLPTPLMPYFGKRYYRFTVCAKQSGLGRTLWERSQEFQVIAPSPSAACNLIKDEIAALVEHPTEIECAGPKGGIIHRWIGYEYLVAAKMFACRPAGEQLPLYL